MSRIHYEPTNLSERIRSHIRETLTLSTQDFMSQTVEMVVTLNRSNGVAGGSDQYLVPGEYVFLVGEIRGHIALDSISTETLFGAGLGAVGGVMNRAQLKAQNTKIKLVDVDSQNRRIIHESTPDVPDASVCLSSLLPVAGGSPIQFVDDNDITPLIIGPGHTLRLDVELSAALGAIASDDAATEYGVQLVGALVRFRE